MKNDNEKKYFSESSLLIEKMEKGTPLKKEIPLDNYSESNGLTKKVTEGTPLQSIIQEEDKNYSESAKFLNDLHREKEVQDTKDYSDSADFIYGLMAEKHTAGLSKDQDTLPEHREKSQGTVLLNRKNSVSDKQYSDSSKFIDNAKREDSDLFDETGTLPLPSREERDAIIRERDLKRKALLGKEASTAQSFREKQPERPLISDTRGLTLVIKSEGQSTKTKQRISTVNHIFSLILSYLFLLVVALLFIFPFYWMIITSFKSGDEIRGYLPGLEGVQTFWPINFVNNYATLNQRFDFGTYVTNTLIVGLFSTIGTLFTCIFAAFAFARLQFKGKNLIFALLLSTMMIPGEMMVVTNYVTVSNLGWTNGTRTGAYIAMIVPFMVSVFYIYLLRQNFMQIPNELYLAAKVDGKSDWQYLWKVMVPLAMPSLVTIFILKLMGSWNSYIWPNLVAGGHDEFKLVSNGLRDSFQTGTNFDEYGRQMAAVVCVTVPLLLVFICFRKYIMRGVSRAGIKG